MEFPKITEMLRKTILTCFYFQNVLRCLSKLVSTRGVVASAPRHIALVTANEELPFEDSNNRVGLSREEAARTLAFVVPGLTLPVQAVVQRLVHI